MPLVLYRTLKLSKQQAMYHFFSGYISRVASTKAGVVSLEPVFSACFGLPIMPLHPFCRIFRSKKRENRVIFG